MFYRRRNPMNESEALTEGNPGDRLVCRREHGGFQRKVWHIGVTAARRSRSCACAARCQLAKMAAASLFGRCRGELKRLLWWCYNCGVARIIGRRWCSSFVVQVNSLTVESNDIALCCRWRTAIMCRMSAFAPGGADGCGAVMPAIIM